MKKYLLSVITFISVVSGFSQGIESFTNIPNTPTPSSYVTRTWTGDNGLPWTATVARTDLTITDKAITIREGAITCANIPNGIGTLSFKHQQVFTGTGGVLEVRINGNLIGTVNPNTSLQTATFANINISGNFSLEIKQTTTGLRVSIDDVAWTTGSTTPCAAPTTQPTNLTFSAVTNNSITGSFTAAAPAADQYLVVMSQASTLTAAPQNGNYYSEGDAIGNGNVLITTSSTSFTATNLSPGSQYYFYVFAVSSSCVGGPIFNTTAALSGGTTTTTPPACTVPTGAVTALNLTPASTSLNGSFTAAANADGYLVVRSTSNALNFTPTTGVLYATGQTVGSGNTGVVVKSAQGTTFSSTGLTVNTTYYFYVYAMNVFNCAGGPLYNTTPVTGSATTTASGSGIPAGYYDTVTTQSCSLLKSALKWRTTTGMTPKTYGDLWNQYISSDVKPREVGTGSATVIWDIYSDNPTGTDPYNFTPGSNQCGNYSKEGDCYNREHSVPQNWFNGNASPGSVGPESDYHHIFPTDGKVNGVRSNYIYGEVATSTSTSLNGSKLGSSALAGFTGPVFEPLNEYKGDLARAFLYFVTRYQDNMPGWPGGSNGVQAFEANTYPSVDVPYLQLMLKWHHQDPVSSKEIDRNNSAFAYQGNRNPFVDHPEYADNIWNNACPGLAALPVNLIFFSGKFVADKIKLEWTAENEQNFDRYEVERSYNGTSFIKIANVASTNSRNYTYSDNADASRGRRVYYRLKKIDKDGNFKYSDVFTLHVPQNTKFTVYPNPANTFIQLQLNNNVTGKVTIQLADALGKVLQQQNVTVSGGTVRLNTNTLSSGTYLVKLLYNGEQYIQKVIVSR